MIVARPSQELSQQWGISYNPLRELEPTGYYAVYPLGIPPTQSIASALLRAPCLRKILNDVDVLSLTAFSSVGLEAFDTGGAAAELYKRDRHKITLIALKEREGSYTDVWLNIDSIYDAQHSSGYYARSFLDPRTLLHQIQHTLDFCKKLYSWGSRF